MHLSASLLTLLPIITLACNHENIARQSQNQTQGNTTLPFDYIPGTDGPADQATSGYFVNHIGLLVSNITASREWYTTVLGMRHVFTIRLNEYYTIMYMAHAQGGRSGQGYQTGAELARDKNNLAGLVEFMQYHPTSKDVKFTPTPQNTLSHMGLIVPDLSAAQARFEKLNVTIVKRVGELDITPETGNRAFAGAWGIHDLGSKETQEILRIVSPGLVAMGFKEFVLIADPDGNLFEVQAFVPTSI
ncbi:Glyoxalase/Bleomycin resistance protein/Dihydroxybiphenyl dioxygenase [Dendryphion nanum]|uniref:Glyoxalase/Bleomycin resistance protein/Dihydroxybiphenyl dioxygenase n=1 Tax=Dendryphion nanum TaxID=256645 RepID=A0A9P9DL32_9PLEO|nr:Glyoxalase/Bleomycin resistance protein/Dihydroxybiphenyl dioxygenase [Dendryphion nanum]